MDLGTLTARNVVPQNFGSTVNERTFVSSVKATWTLAAWTGLEDRGPIEVGLAHSDYSTAEILEFLTQSGSWNETDLISQEIGRRKIRRIGIFEGPEGPGFSEVLNEGRPIHTKCGWILNQGQTLKMWAFNTGSVAVGGTDPKVTIVGHANLWPK